MTRFQRLHSLGVCGLGTLALLTSVVSCNNAELWDLDIAWEEDGPHQHLHTGGQASSNTSSAVSEGGAGGSDSATGGASSFSVGGQAESSSTTNSGGQSGVGGSSASVSATGGTSSFSVGGQAGSSSSTNSGGQSGVGGSSASVSAGGTPSTSTVSAPLIACGAGTAVGSNCGKCGYCKEGYCAPKPANVLCGGTDVGCDDFDYCDGVTLECTVDRVKAAGTPCGTYAQEQATCQLSNMGRADYCKQCDAQDYCDGTSKTCVDALKPPGTLCGPSDTGDTCLIMHQCVSASPYCFFRYATSGAPCRKPDGKMSICAGYQGGSTYFSHCL